MVAHSKFRSKKQNVTILQVTPSANAIIGEWILEVDTKKKDDKNSADFRYKVQEPFVLLFNPWCESKFHSYLISISFLVIRFT